ncbi:MAG: L,D-transpeptidase family protein [Helicobacteraceae bacterium]|jgi:murein L,D-transpeptidase YafK|nr:L,D-transpeptidase family protein [Helicobacteraceae bacterium]
MRKFWFLFAFAIDLVAAEDFADIYRSKGLEALEIKANETLSDPSYWLERLQKIETRFGYFESQKHILIVDKAARRLSFYDYKESKLTHIADYDATMGDAVGDKFKAGDNKTPVGAYDIASKLKQNGGGLYDPYYGPLAYVTNYPNAFDRMLKKTGHGIWLHGFPLNGSRQNPNTKGCVAIDNEALSSLETQVDHKKIALLINENGVLEARKEDIALVLATIYKWRWTWKNNDLEGYLALYAKDFRRSDGISRLDFDKIKRLIFGKGETKRIEFSDIEVVPYPNSLNELIYKASFWQDYKARTHSSSRVKELYLRKSGDRFEIALER